MWFGSREVIFLCAERSFPTSISYLVTNLPQLAAHLEAGQLPEVKTVLEQQNAIEHVPAAYVVRCKGCDRGREPLGSEVQRESL